MGKHRFRARHRVLRASRITLIVIASLAAAAVAPVEAAQPEGTLTVEDIVLKPLWENLLSRDGKGNLTPMLAERWQVLDGGKTWRFHLRKGVRFHGGGGGGGHR